MISLELVKEIDKVIVKNNFLVCKNTFQSFAIFSPANRPNYYIPLPPGFLIDLYTNLNNDKSQFWKDLYLDQAASIEYKIISEVLEKDSNIKYLNELKKIFKQSKIFNYLEKYKEKYVLEFIEENIKTNNGNLSRNDVRNILWSSGQGVLQSFSNLLLDYDNEKIINLLYETVLSYESLFKEKDLYILNEWLLKYMKGSNTDIFNNLLAGVRSSKENIPFVEVENNPGFMLKINKNKLYDQLSYDIKMEEGMKSCQKALELFENFLNEKKVKKELKLSNVGLIDKKITHKNYLFMIVPEKDSELTPDSFLKLFNYYMDGYPKIIGDTKNQKKNMASMLLSFKLNEDLSEKSVTLKRSKI